MLLSGLAVAFTFAHVAFNLSHTLSCFTCNNIVVSFWHIRTLRPTDTLTLKLFQKDMEKTCSTNTVRLWQTQDIKDLFIEENGQLFYIKPANYEISDTRK